MDGEVEAAAGTTRASFVNAALDKASHRERAQRPAGCVLPMASDVTCVQVAGLIARRVLCYVQPGDKLSRGQRYGFIRFGSRVDLYLPTDSQIKVTIGEKVFATSTLVAELS
ncbi:MAG: phosphatidylserine decarboxylase [Chromatiales bacterium]|nr:phosphatidylserine decarboxylase [Chromatiales bacterium]